MTDKFIKETIKKYSLIVIGCIVYSVGVALLLDPNELAAGGVTGIAIIINYLSNGAIGTGWLIVIINVPLFILGMIFFGKSFIISTLISLLLSSGLIELFNVTLVPLMPKIDNMLIPATVGGALYGCGLGLIFRAGSTTGGTDIIVKLLRKKFRHLRTGILSMMTDIAVVTFSACIYRDIDLLFYTVISIILFTLAFDLVLYGGNSAKLVYIITSCDKIDPIKERIIKDLDISATILDGSGAYSGEQKAVLLCVIKNYLYPKLRDVIKEVDPTAFVIVTSAKEIYGEGYTPHDAEEL